MADQPDKPDEAKSEPIEAAVKPKSERRKIPGNLPYTGTPGSLRKALDNLTTSEKPRVFNPDFVGTVLQVTGGSGRPIPPILKSMGLLDAGGVPTELYSQFQTDTGRSNAALQALKTGYAEVFRRNQFAHRADEKALIDLIVAITGLPKTDGIVRAISSTFQVFQKYAAGASDEAPKPVDRIDQSPSAYAPEPDETPPLVTKGSLGLVYNINVVLPETTNIEVYNAIFRSLKGNLL